MAVLVIVALWIVAGAVVLTATRKPSEVADLVLAGEPSVAHVAPLSTVDQRIAA